MNSYTNPKIFLSYSWQNTDKANEVDDDFKTIGIKLTRDIRDLSYGLNIREFTQRISEHNFMMPLISVEFLQSENCMQEVFIFINVSQEKVGMLPVVLDNAKHVLKLEGRRRYYDYWETKLAEAEADYKQRPNQDYLNRVRDLRNINNMIDSFFALLAERNAETFSRLKSDKYIPLLNICGYSDKRIWEKIDWIRNLADTAQRTKEMNAFLEEYDGTSNAEYYQAYFGREKKEYQKAEQLFVQYINKYKDNPLSKLGGAYSNLAQMSDENFKDYKGAVSYYKEALRCYPPQHRSDTHNSIGVILYNKLNDFAGAKFHFEEAINLNSEFAIALGNLGLLLKNNFKDYTAAHQHLQRALRIDAELIYVRYNLAVLLEEWFRDYEGAKMHYKQLTTLTPKDADVHYRLGLLLANYLNDFKTAKDYLTQAVTLNPRMVDAHFELGRLLYNKFSDYMNALLHFRQALLLNPKTSMANYNIGLIYLYQWKDPAKAIPYFEEELRIAPKNQSAKEKLSEAKKKKWLGFFS